MNSKVFYISKTIIFNVLTIVSVLLAGLATEDFLSEGLMKWILVTQSLVNIGLRIVTKEELSLKKES